MFITTNTWPDAISQIGWLPSFAQDYLLEHRHSWGIYLPENILIKLRDKIDRNDEWLISNFNWLVHQVNYNKNFPKKVEVQSALLSSLNTLLDTSVSYLKQLSS